MKAMATSCTLKILALAALALHFCVRAPSAEIAQSIVPAVDVTWPTTTNKAYQVLISTNLLGVWVPASSLIEGTGGQVGAFFTATNFQRFFKIQETNGSGVAWLEGVWQGVAYQQ